MSCSLRLGRGDPTPVNSRTPLAAAFVLGALLCAGLLGLGAFVTHAVLAAKSLERTVTVKGLSEREVPADVAIWPIRFSEAADDLVTLYAAIEKNDARVMEFLRSRGFGDAEISVAPPSIVDREAQGYGRDQGPRFRYTATSTLTVYSTQVDRVRAAMNDLAQLGKQGIALSGQEYEARTQFLFTGLNGLKPEMVEEATRNAREVASRFAQDSDSTLGKIRSASQGQFSIEDRDSNTPHVKKVRVVSTVEYYLSD
jgi:uncharacterized protein